MTEKKYNTKKLALGFTEGSYNNDIYELYTEGNKIKEDKKTGENIEEMIEDSEILLNGARGQ